MDCTLVYVKIGLKMEKPYFLKANVIINREIVDSRRFRNDKNFKKNFDKFLREYFKTKTVAFSEGRNDILGHYIIVKQGDIKVEGWYTDYFGRRT
jgi:hypothetical protein